MPPSTRPAKLRFAPATAGRWNDIERLFGPRGAMAGCWCMWWRLSRAEFKKGAGAGNRLAFKRIVERGAAPGILAYEGGEPVGWCSVAPKADFASLDRSRTKRLDDTPTDPKTWAVTCFFIPRPHRGKGLSEALLREAAAYARQRGARTVEGYPIDAGKKEMDFTAFMGTVAVFQRCGFKEAARPVPNRPIMRRQTGR
ncbi:MAG: GNAT family N-acetyltransferase [Rhodospirillales bacterium]